MVAEVVKRSPQWCLRGGGAVVEQVQRRCRGASLCRANGGGAEVQVQRCRGAEVQRSKV